MSEDVQITRPAKVLFPDSGITKGDLIRYYERIADRILPHLKGRPLMLQRFPDGVGRPGFIQKAAPAYYPSWIERVTVPKEGGTVSHVVCNDARTLVYLANQACVTLHTWLSCAGDLHSPDQMMLDLDPSRENDIAGVVSGALALKRILEDLGLPAYVKSTGSRGLHVTVPLDGQHDFDFVRAFARQLAGILVDRDASRFTLEQHKEKRRGRVLIDVNRNGYAQTAVAAFSVRARAGAPVSLPIDWGELRRKSFRPDAATMRNIFERLDSMDDPWKNFRRDAVSLKAASRKLGTLHAA